MTTSIQNARDEITTLFKTAWDAGAESAGMVVLWPDVAGDIPKTDSVSDNPLPWARFNLQHTGGVQGSLAGSNGARRWSRSGLVTVQIFTPFGTGLSLADKLAMIVVAAFEGQQTPSGVWFRNVRSEEIGMDGNWFQTNVRAEFIYDEVR